MLSLFAFLSFSIGIAIGTLHTVSLIVMVILSAIIIALFLICKKPEFAVTFGLCVCLFFIGSLRTQLAENKFTARIFPNQSVVIGTVKSIDERAESTLFYVRPEGSKMNIIVRSYEKVLALPGDMLQSLGAVELPESFTTDTGRIFNYPNYLKSKNVALVQNAKGVEILKTGNWSISRFFAKLNHDTGDLLVRSVPYPVDGITGGMVLGDRGSIPKTVTDIFQNTGTLHLLVLSGYNITLLVTFLGILLRRIPFYIKILLLAASIISLVFLSGAGIAAIRAGIMGLIVLLGTVSGRQYAALRALGITFVLLLLWNPFLLLYDPGFQLSFLATLCMIVVIPKVEPFFKKIPEKVWILPLRETFVITVTVSLFMLPFIVYFSGSISLLTIPANFIAAFFVPLITFLGIGVIFLSAVIPFLGVLLGTVLGLFGNILLFILEVAARVPRLTISPFSWGYVALIYSVIFLALFWKEIKRSLLVKGS